MATSCCYALRIICKSLPGNKELGNVLREGLCHVLGADVGDALQGEAHVNRIPRDEVVLDAVVDQVDQVAVLADQHRYEEISLRKKDNKVHVQYQS